MLELTLYNAAQHLQLPLVGGRIVLGTSEGLALTSEPNEAIHALLETVVRSGHERLSVTNRGQSIVLPGGQRILPGMSRELELPAEFWAGRTNVYVQPHDVPQ